MNIDLIKNTFGYLKNKKGVSGWVWIVVAIIIAVAIIVGMMLYNQGQASKPVPFWYK